MKAMNISTKLNSAFQWFKVGQPWDDTISYCLLFSKMKRTILNSYTEHLRVHMAVNILKSLPIKFTPDLLLLRQNLWKGELVQHGRLVLF
jgi:hypothetical protein